jgi:hypothetical protein
MAEALYDNFRGRMFLGPQILRLMDTVYRVESGNLDHLLCCGEDEAARWTKVVAEAETLNIRRDAKSDRYTFLNGTALAEALPSRDLAAEGGRPRR